MDFLLLLFYCYLLWVLQATNIAVEYRVQRALDTNLAYWRAGDVGRAGRYTDFSIRNQSLVFNALFHKWQEERKDRNRRRVELCHLLPVISFLHTVLSFLIVATQLKTSETNVKNIDSVVKQTLQFREQTLPNPTKAGKYKLKRIRTTATF